MNATPFLVEIGEALQTAALEAVLIGIIKSKKAARRPRDAAVLEVLEKALEEQKQKGATRRRPSRE